MRLLRVTAATLAALPLLAWADVPAQNPILMSAKAQANADASTAAQMAALMQQWSAAVIAFAHQAGSAIPWNTPYTTQAINYAPLYLYAGPGGAAACRFVGGSGTPLPTVAGINLSQPVNLAGVTLNLAAGGSEQAKAYQQVVGNGNTFFPQNAGGPFGGTFCAAVSYISDNALYSQKIQVATWYAPSAQALSQSAASGGKTAKMIAYDAAQNFTNALNQSAMGGSVNPIYSMNAGGDPGTWIQGVPSKAMQFFRGLLSNLPGMSH